MTIGRKIKFYVVVCALICSNDGVSVVSGQEICYFSPEKFQMIPTCNGTVTHHTESTCEDNCRFDPECGSYTYMYKDNQDLCYSYQCFGILDTLSMKNGGLYIKDPNDYVCTYSSTYQIDRWYALTEDYTILDSDTNAGCQNLCKTTSSCNSCMRRYQNTCYLFNTTDIVHIDCGSSCKFEIKHCMDTEYVYNDNGPETAGNCPQLQTNEAVRSRDECYYKCENLPSCLGVAIKETISGNLRCYFYGCNISKFFSLPPETKDVRFYDRSHIGMANRLCYFSLSSISDVPICNGTYSNRTLDDCYSACELDENCKGIMHDGDRNCYSYTCSDTIQTPCRNCRLMVQDCDPNEHPYEAVSYTHPLDIYEVIQTSTIEECKDNCTFFNECTSYKIRNRNDLGYRECFLYSSNETRRVVLPEGGWNSYTLYTKTCHATNCSYIYHGQNTTGYCFSKTWTGIAVWSVEECFVMCEEDDYCGGVSTYIDDNGRLRCNLHWCNTPTKDNDGLSFYSRTCPGLIPYYPEVTDPPIIQQFQGCTLEKFPLYTVGNCSAIDVDYNTNYTLCIEKCINYFNCSGVTYKYKYCYIHTCTSPILHNINYRFTGVSCPVLDQICYYSVLPVEFRPSCDYFTSGSATEDECIQFCSNTPKCAGYIYDTVISQCYFYQCFEVVIKSVPFYKKNEVGFEMYPDSYPFCNATSVTDKPNHTECRTACNSDLYCSGYSYSQGKCRIFNCSLVSSNTICFSCSYKRKHCKSSTCSFPDAFESAVGDCIYRPFNGILVWSENHCFYQCDSHPFCGGVTVRPHSSGRLQCFLHWCNVSTEYTAGNSTFYPRSCTNPNAVQESYKTGIVATNETIVSDWRFQMYETGVEGGCFPNIDGFFDMTFEIDCLYHCLNSDRCQGVTWISQFKVCGIHNCSQPVKTFLGGRFYLLIGKISPTSTITLDESSWEYHISSSFKTTDLSSFTLTTTGFEQSMSTNMHMEPNHLISTLSSDQSSAVLNTGPDQSISTVLHTEPDHGQSISTFSNMELGLTVSSTLYLEQGHGQSMSTSFSVEPQQTASSTMYTETDYGQLMSTSSSVEPQQTVSSKLYTETDYGQSMSTSSSVEPQQTVSSKLYVETDYGQLMSTSSSVETQQTVSSSMYTETDYGQSMSTSSSTEPQQTVSSTLYTETDYGQSMSTSSSIEPHQTVCSTLYTEADYGQSMSTSSSTEPQKTVSSTMYTETDFGQSMSTPSYMEPDQTIITTSYMEPDTKSAQSMDTLWYFESGQSDFRTSLFSEGTQASSQPQLSLHFPNTPMSLTGTEQLLTLASTEHTVDGLLVPQTETVSMVQTELETKSFMLNTSQFSELSPPYTGQEVSYTSYILSDEQTQTGTEQVTLSTTYYTEQNMYTTYRDITSFNTGAVIMIQSSTSQGNEESATESLEPSIITLPFSTTSSLSQFQGYSSFSSNTPILVESTSNMVISSSFYQNNETIKFQATSTLPAVEGTCSCSCQNVTFHEFVERTEEAIKALKVNKSLTSKTKRKLISAKDDRPSSTNVGSVAVALMVTVVIVIVVPDFISFINFFRTCISNGKN